jgi:hypothetical protein
MGNKTNLKDVLKDWFYFPYLIIKQTVVGTA